MMSNELPNGPFVVTYIDLGGQLTGKVVDADLARLKGLSGLGVFIAHNELTDEGVAHVSRIPTLGWLTLMNTKVTDAGVAHLRDATNLNTLQLQGTAVGDTGLTALHGLNKLTALELQGTKVTAAGVAKLAKALPKCKIAWDGGIIEPTAKADADRAAAEWRCPSAARLSSKTPPERRESPRRRTCRPGRSP